MVKGVRGLRRSPYYGTWSEESSGNESPGGGKTSLSLAVYGNPMSQDATKIGTVLESL